MKFIDLDAQYQKLRGKIDENISNVLAHGQFVMGPEVHELEDRLARYASVKHAVTCANGTEALLMPLMAWGVGRGDAVFTTAFSFFATAEVISLVGATPVFVDVDAGTFNICTEALEKEIERVEKERTLNAKAVIAVDLFGLSADYSKISAIAARHGLKVLEDAAQSFGASFHGKKTCGFGDAAATSFFPAKPLGCYGDGGAVFTDDDGLAALLRSIRNHGQGADKYENKRVGLNSRLDTLQAAVLLAKLDVLDEEIKQRNHIAENYSRLLDGAARTQTITLGATTAWAQYSVLAQSKGERAAIRGALLEADIPTMVYYEKPLHMQGAFSGLGYAAGDFPVAEDLSGRIFSLPMHPYLEGRQIDEICRIVKRQVKKI